MVHNQMNRLIETGTDIALIEPSNQNIGYSHSILCQVGLPRSRVLDSEFMRVSGSAWLSIQSGYLDEGIGPVKQIIPYGSVPRLALAWMSTYAIKNKTQEIKIGNSPRKFLTNLGLDSQGTRYLTLRKQMNALASCRLQVGFKGRTFSGQPVKQFDAWLSDDNNARSLWPGVLLLTDDFYNSLINHAVPFDYRALLELKSSSLSLDIYIWLAQRLHLIESKGITLSWKSIRVQFAQEYNGNNADKNFKKEFLPKLKKVKLVYPQANVKITTNGIILYGSPPPVKFIS